MKTEAVPAIAFKGFDFEKPILDLEQQIQKLQDVMKSNGVVEITAEIAALQQRCEELKREVYGGLTPWQRVQMARHPMRPYALDYIQKIFTDFIEFHGDRCFAEDKAVVAGVGCLDGDPVMVLGHQKGRTLQESMARNFGMPHPEGYRKAMRLMRLAARSNWPIVTLIDTPGAYPGIGAEERGQATAIAENLRDMSELSVPIVCCVIGEGGSGGALALGVGDRLLMLENAWYSVISPEGCAAILYRDPAKSTEAARAMKVTAADLKALGLVDEVITEPLGGAHRDPDATAASVKSALKTHLQQIQALSVEKRLELRYQKYRSVGHFEEGVADKPAKAVRPKSVKKKRQPADTGRKKTEEKST